MGETVPIEPTRSVQQQQIPKRIPEKSKEEQSIEVSKSDFPIAGRIHHFYEEWQKLTKDPNILQMVGGCKIDFTSTPVQHSARETKLNELESSCVDIEIKRLLDKGVLKKSTSRYR